MPATEAAKEVSKAVSNDIAVFRTRFDVETGKGRKKRLTPVEAELHVNPVSIAVAAAAALLGTLAGTIAWHGINIPSPIPGVPPIQLLKGLKETGLGSDLSRSYTRFKQQRDSEAAAKLAQTLPVRCADARTGILKMKDLLERADEFGCDAACQQSLRDQIKVLEAFIAENCN